MIRKLLLSLFFVSLLLVSPIGHCSEAEYKMTTAELTRFEEIFQQLESNNNNQLIELNQWKNDLTIARQDLVKYQKALEEQKIILLELKNELNKAKTELEIAQTSLEKVNKSFEEYAKEVKRTENRLKLQRNTWSLISGLLLIGAVSS